MEIDEVFSEIAEKFIAIRCEVIEIGEKCSEIAQKLIEIDEIFSEFAEKSVEILRSSARSLWPCSRGVETLSMDVRCQEPPLTLPIAARLFERGAQSRTARGQSLHFHDRFAYGTSVAAKVYLETSVISYLAARPARDVVVLAHQQLTREWWDLRRGEFELYTSEVVLAESDRGNPEAARGRREIIRQTIQLSASHAAERLVPVLLSATGLPVKALADMAHIALATVHGMHYLLTWNCKHIANAAVQRTVIRTCQSRGYEPPVICTPEGLMGA